MVPLGEPTRYPPGELSPGKVSRWPVRSSPLVLFRGASEPVILSAEGAKDLSIPGPLLRRFHATGMRPARTRNRKEPRTMRFMMLVIPKGYEKAAADFTPPADLVAKMTKYNESLTKAGVLLGLDALQPPATGARVRFSGGKPNVTDGPFTEAKEVLGGYWMIQVKSRAEAIEWAKGAPLQG